MFSQFRQAVEGFAQPQPRRSQDLNGDDNRFTSDPLDVQSARQLQSTNQLADAALNNLRRSFASQRPGSPLSRSSSPVSSSVPKSNSTPDPGLRKFTLEERLRASFSVGDASNTTSPGISSRASPASSAVVVTQHPLSPTSIPLPASPVILPVAASPPQVSDTQPSDLPSHPSPFPLAATHLQDASEEGPHATSTTEVPQALALAPLPLGPEKAPVAEYSDSLLPKPVSVSTGIEENLQLPNDLPADTYTALPSEVHGSDSGDIDGEPDIPIHTDAAASYVSEVHGSDSGDIENTADVAIHTDASTSHMSEVHGSDSGDIDGNADVPIQIEVLTSDGNGEKTEQPPEDPFTVPSSKCSEADVEALQERLKTRGTTVLRCVDVI
ncbi:hypothetical protein DFJ58DRAFT_202477 [Suillus subalutaceus]|uniref:uncharacterized protein n=1 Tax=Suillus subalutaceus TaxID=48586 RepID=UPI001B870450|nr:uncharacterized protein DFJ58DRAFT_202477 [Suillus subalutaceus]KAG1864128.1 hypothetical protein DFJ58DRAFT_202477 [Suillus subalutaceus]